MNNKLLFLVTAQLLILPVSMQTFAADEAALSGSVGIGGRIGNGEDDSAKLQEYRDLSDNVLGDISLDYSSDINFLSLEGNNIGLDDQSYNLTGGSYGKYKGTLFYNEMPHNLSFDARTFYSGNGGDRLSIDNSSPRNESTWKTFDYKVDIKDYGATFDFILAAPYFLNIGASRNEKDGVKPLGTGSFSGMIEMPEPVDYATNDLTFNGGYRSEQMSIKINGLYSSFSNDDNYLSWQNPFTNATEVNSLPQDNDYTKLGADFVLRQLPMQSTFRVQGAYTHLSNDFDITSTVLAIPTGLNQTKFEGDIDTTRLSASYSSAPMDKLDTRLFFSYYDRNNDSTIIEYTGGGNEDFLLDYTKWNLGFDAGYKLPYQTALDAGYMFENIDRDNRPDGDSNTDNLLHLKLKNTSLEYLTARIEYTFLNRDTDEDHDVTGLSITDAEYITPFVQRFDVAKKNKNKIKFAFELYPLETLDLGLSYAFVNNDYKDVTLGRTNDKGHEFYVDVMWRAATMLKLNGFAGYERYEADSNHYNFSLGQSADPNFDDRIAASYRWGQSIVDDFWTMGLTAEMPLMKDRLKLSCSWQYQKSNGKSDFTTEGPSVLQPLNQYEDFDINTVAAKATYALTENVDLTLGYLYERAEYNDEQYNDYDYTPSGSYLSGAYSDHDYEANVGYMIAKYHF
jgi:MtrB/PioB family decaheme-associated outer membrane protein